MSNDDNFAIPIPNPASFFREDQAGWGVLVNMDTAASVALNPTGSMIWKLVDGKRSCGDIASAFMNSFQESPLSLYEDVVVLLDCLAEDGLIGYEVRT
ncbi:MAG: PqqD family protein [Methanothrix sp.]|nr:PqqD family protein [Methanothrix sp.]